MMIYLIRFFGNNRIKPYKKNINTGKLNLTSYFHVRGNFHNNNATYLITIICPISMKISLHMMDQYF
jgi:hypothetical protein